MVLVYMHVSLQKLAVQIQNANSETDFRTKNSLLMKDQDLKQNIFYCISVKCFIALTICRTDLMEYSCILCILTPLHIEEYLERRSYILNEVLAIQSDKLLKPDRCIPLTQETMLSRDTFISLFHITLAHVHTHTLKTTYVFPLFPN